MDPTINLVDVGGSEGLHQRWTPHLSSISATLFEPNPVEAEKIRQQYSNLSTIKVLEQALWNRRGMRSINMANHFGCTSMRKPDLTLLAQYELTQFFQTEAVEQVFCDRFDDLMLSDKLAQPDIVKIDVQGCEFEVLEGFGSSLDFVLAIELEAHFYPIYKGQKLLGDIIGLLGEFDLVLSKISPTPHFKKDIVEVDVLFTPNCVKRGLLPTHVQEKLMFIESVYDV